VCSLVVVRIICVLSESSDGGCDVLLAVSDREVNGSRKVERGEGVLQAMLMREMTMSVGE
jgi:hypothetical protein